MKKLITSLAVILPVVSVYSASINWSITGSTTAVANDYSGNPYASTAYLIVASDLSSISDASQVKDDFLDALADLTVTSVAVPSAGTKPSVSNQPVKSDLLTAGSATTFGLLIVSEDAAGNGYYKVVTSTGTPYADGATADAQTKVATAWNFGNKQWVQGYSVQLAPDPGPTPGVPEPATGALALAGVALLFKRRRA